jgi:fructan beta-fructosidase
MHWLLVTFLLSQPPAAPAKFTECEVALDHPYVHLPIKKGAKKRLVTFLIDGKEIVRNTIELADDKPEWYAPIAFGGHTGKRLTIRVDELPTHSQALQNISARNTIVGSNELYREPLRAQYHFSAQRGWVNDPNGLVYFNSEYHLFFQHNPYGWDWGNMHWGHAVSKDLVHWKELGDKLLPDALGRMFSGSAVVDWENTTGWGKPDNPAMVLIYTAAGNPATQCLAYSLDGRTFTKYDKNPVLKQITPGNRDPKVIWHAPTKQWVMVLYVEVSKRHTVHFFTSPNLKDWKLASVTEGGTMGKDGYLYECPDFFELNVDDDNKSSKWVLMGANSEYAIGTFDGVKFTAEQSRLSGQQGKGFYAPQTFSNTPDEKPRRLQIGWLQTPTPGMPFNQAMSIPMELKLVSTPQGVRLTRLPVKELEKLRKNGVQHSQRAVTPSRELLLDITPLPLRNSRYERKPSDQLLLKMECVPDPETEVQILLRGVPVRYRTAKQELIVGEHRVAAPLQDGKQTLTIFLDTNSIEVFASNGLVYVPLPVPPPSKRNDLNSALSVVGGECQVRSLTLHHLQSIWK